MPDQSKLPESNITTQQSPVNQKQECSLSSSSRARLEFEKPGEPAVTFGNDQELEKEQPISFRTTHQVEQPKQLSIISSSDLLVGEPLPKRINK